MVTPRKVPMSTFANKTLAKVSSSPKFSGGSSKTFSKLSGTNVTPVGASNVSRNSSDASNQHKAYSF